MRRLDAIVFRNFYCSHITIKRRQHHANLATGAGGGTDADPWVTILQDRPLMEDPHHEDDAQYWHVVRAEEFDQEEFDSQSTAPLRSVLHPTGFASVHVVAFYRYRDFLPITPPFGNENLTTRLD